MPVPELAGLTDVGRRHPWNEDAMALGAKPNAYVLVVCDGVSSARDSQRMAQLASELTRDRLMDLADTDPVEGMRLAIQAAHEALCAVPEPDSVEAVGPKSQAPGCTIVAAHVDAAHATIGWVGDSRAYGLHADRDELLTHDHSWFNEVVDSGAMSPAEAAQAPERNAITRCIGPLGQDEPGQVPEVDVVVCELDSGQLLLLCSDGLWKYASEPGELARLAQAAPSGMQPIDIARHLVEYANQCGGTDNITAAVLKVP
jgi:serine/threonine protein phosphatase PrpC